VGAVRSPERLLTQQYIVGEFSLLLAELGAGRVGALRGRVDSLRHRVEHTPVPSLSCLVPEALDLADAVCWTALAQGDADDFRRRSRTAAALAEFAAGADLLPPRAP